MRIFKRFFLVFLMSFFVFSFHGYAAAEMKVEVNRDRAVLGNEIAVRLIGGVKSGDTLQIRTPDGKDMSIPIKAEEDSEDSGFLYARFQPEVIGEYAIVSVGGQRLENTQKIKVFKTVNDAYGESSVLKVNLGEDTRLILDDFLSALGRVQAIDQKGRFVPISCTVNGEAKYEIINDGLMVEVNAPGPVAYQPGEYTLEFKALGKSVVKKIKIVDNKSSANYVRLAASEEKRAEVLRFAGSDRYKTAVAISKSGFAYANQVVLVNGRSFPDALTAGAFAYQLNCPLLFADGDSLNTDTLNEIKRLKAKDIYIVGGQSGIKNTIQNGLMAQGYVVKRIQGANRFATATALASQLQTFGKVDTVIIANGFNFPDALSIAPYSALKNIPILYADKDDINESTLNFIKASKVKDVLIVGGTNSISASVEGQLRALNLSITRVAGNNRYDTSAQIAQKFFGQAVKSVIANGQNFPDALAGGVYAAKISGPVLLTDGHQLEAELKTYIEQKSLTEFACLGGNSSISESLKGTLDQLAKSIIEKLQKTSSSNEEKPTSNDKDRNDTVPKTDPNQTAEPEIKDMCIPRDSVKLHSPIRIMLDPGHGAGSNHNRGFIGGNEGDNNYKMALKLKKALEKYGFYVNMTRKSITDDPSLKARGEMGRGYDLLLSIHSNASSNNTIRGSEIFDDVCYPNKPLASKILNTIVSTFGHTSRGVKYKWYETNIKSNWYGVLRYSEASYAMLIEHGFHTNEVDAALLRDDAFQTKLMENEARAIAEYFGYTK